MGVYMKENGQLKKGAGLYKQTVPLSAATYYSEDEHKIGTWIDGKIVYQKTFKFTSGWIVGNWTDMVDLSSLNIDTFIKSSGTFYRATKDLQYTFEGEVRPETNSGYLVSTRYYQSKLAINVQTYNDISEIDVTIQYTKTTDNTTGGVYAPIIPMELASKYNTEEKAIGEWINQKTLYQKTVVIENPVYDTYWHDVTFSSIGLSNVESIIGFEGILLSGNGWLANISSYKPTTTYGIIIEISVESQILQYMNNWMTTSATGVMYVTLKYTKTTDTAGVGLYSDEEAKFSMLGDVEFDELEDGQVPVYDAETGKWTNGEAGSGNTNMWTGTQAEYEEVADEIPEGTLVNITDDEQEVVEGGTIYSEDEQVIGLWKNNKPLYQKTIVIGNGNINVNQGASPNFYAIVDSNISNLDEAFAIVDKSYMILASDNSPRNFSWIDYQGMGSSEFVLYSITSRTNVTVILTIQYTKSTDAPIDVVVGKKTMYIASSDCYSTEEKEIGVWKDGKPLYQRVFDLGSDLGITQNAFTNTTIDASNMETLVDAKAIYSTGVTIYNVIANISNNIIRLQADRNDTSISARYIILQYTKTTDTAGSGQYTPASGKAVHYSTDEQVVGTYFGETLYEKTIYVDGTFAMGNNYQITHDLTGIKRLVDMDGSYYDVVDSRDYALPNLRQDWSESVYIAGFVPSNHVPIIALQSGGYNYGNVKDVSITVKYTKV